MEHGRENCTKVKDPVQEAMVFRERLEHEARQEQRQEKQRTAAMLCIEMKRKKKQVLALPHGEFQKLLDTAASAGSAACGSGSTAPRRLLQDALFQDVAELELKVKLLAEKIAKGEDYGVARVEGKPVRIDSWNGNADDIMKLMLADNFISRYEVSYGDLNGDGAEWVVQQYLQKLAAGVDVDASSKYAFVK
eukprot:jgi/Chrzof1/14339/UNPLg00613.t1